MDIHIIDAASNHTGLIPNPNPASDLRIFEKTIPNSYYKEIGETKYAGASAGTTTVLRLQGTGLGFFTLNIEQTLGDTVTASTTYENLPVTSDTIASMVIPQGGFTEDTIPDLVIDVDGDGINDVTISGGGAAGLLEEQLLAMIKAIVKTLDLPVEKKAKLLKIIRKIEQELAKERPNEHAEEVRTSLVSLKLLKTIEQYKMKNILTKSEANELRIIIQRIRASGEGMFRFPDKKPGFKTWTQEEQDRRWWGNWKLKWGR